MINQSDFRHTGRIMYFLHLTLLVVYQIGHVRYSSDYVHIKLTVETFLYNFHVKQAQETTTETKAQSYGRFRHESQGSIVQLEFFERRTKIFIIFGINRIKTCKHHWLYFFKTGNCLITRTGNVGNGIPHFYFLRCLDTRNDVTYITGTQFIPRNHIHFQHTDFIGIIFLTGIEKLHLVSFTDYTVLNLEISNDTTERIEYRVENQSLKRCFFITFRMRNAFHHCIENFFYSQTCLTGSTDNFFTLTSQQIDNFVFYFIWHSAIHVALIHHWNDFQIVFQCHVEIGDSLRLYTLGCINHQQGTFASRDRTGHFV